MEVRARSIWIATLLACALLIPSSGAGQTPDGRIRIGGFVSGALGDGGPTPAVGLSGTYRFNPRLSLEVDASYVPGLDFGRIPVCPPGLYCVAGLVTETFRGGNYELHGRAGLLSANLRSELRMGAGRIRPYVVGGGGLATVRRQLLDTTLPFRWTVMSTGPSVTMGGGVEILVGHGLAVGIDVREQWVFQDQQFSRSDVPHNLALTRIGSSLSYRF